MARYPAENSEETKLALFFVDHFWCSPLTYVHPAISKLPFILTVFSSVGSNIKNLYEMSQQVGHVCFTTYPEGGDCHIKRTGVLVVNFRGYKSAFGSS